MAKMYVNNRVMDNYTKGMTINDAIMNEFGEEYESRIKNDASLKNFTPLNMVLRDANINRYSTVGDIMNTAYESNGTADTNEWLFPIWLDSKLNESVAAANMINYLVSTTVNVDSSVVKSAMLDLNTGKNAKAVQIRRVAELADLPTARITLGSKAVSLYKKGLAVEFSYEAARRMNIDLFTKHMSAVVADTARQEQAEAVETLRYGDGNGNAAMNLGTLTGGLTQDNLIDLLIDYEMKNNFAADTVVVDTDTYKKVAKMLYNVNEASGISNRVSFTMPQLNIKDIVVLHADLAKESDKNVILLANRANTLQRFVENGSVIQEAASYAKNQSKMLTYSVCSGYGIGMVNSNAMATF
jgi:hypothetical protein